MRAGSGWREFSLKSARESRQWLLAASLEAGFAVDWSFVNNHSEFVVYGISRQGKGLTDQP